MGLQNFLLPPSVKGEPMTTAEKIYRTVKEMPEPVLREVLDFAEFLKQKKNPAELSLVILQNVFRTIFKAWMRKTFRFHLVSYPALHPYLKSDEPRLFD
jgi:pyruvate-formate lyase-activating enzyme